jgi:hypothetical protein
MHAEVLLMKKFMFVGAMLALGSAATWAGSICPAGSGANPFPHSPDPTATGCNAVLTIAANGSITVAVTDSTPYENSEDVLIGVVNNSATSVTSINLNGGSAAIPIFGFDGDGICIYTFVGSSYCTASQTSGADPGDYAGPTSTFTGISSGQNTGTVNFSPGIPANGGTTYFSLEGVPSASLAATVGGTGSGTGAAAAPALSTWGMGLLVLMLAGLSFRLMKKQTA